MGTKALGTEVVGTEGQQRSGRSLRENTSVDALLLAGYLLGHSPDRAIPRTSRTNTNTSILSLTNTGIDLVESYAALMLHPITLEFTA